MRNVDPHLLGDKMDDAVTHYINTHQPGEHVHIDTDGMPMSVQDDGSRITVMHQQTYSSHLCRQVTEPVGDGPWGEELLDPEGRIAAIVAQLASSRTSHPHPHHKVSARNEVDASVILDSSIRYNGPNLNQQSVSLATLPPMQTLPPLQEMKRCETDWFTDKNKKSEAQIGQLTDSDGPVLELPSGSPAHSRQQSRKSLPHKKRISRKLKRNHGGSTPQQDLVVINNIEPVVAPVVEEEQILPDNYVTVPQQAHHIPHEVQVRPILICQICGGFFGDEQLKFFQHLKQHYEPHNIIMDSPVADLVMDKITSTCIVDNVAQLPDSIVELSLENSVPKTLYQPVDKHAHSHIVPLNYNHMKVQYSMASVDKETPVEAEKADLYETLNKLDFYNCGKCNKTFRKQKQCEAHMREAHPSHTKLEDMGEFSEPEDLMAGIHVCVGEYEPPLLPHLTVDNGHVTQDHTRHWYSRNGAQLDPCDSCNECTNDAYCAGCDRDTQQHTQTHETQPHHSQPHHTQPHHSQPHHTQPHHTQPHHPQPHHTQPHHTQPHHAQPHHTQPHHTQSHHTQPHHTQSHHTQPIHVSEQHIESHQSHDSHSQHDSHSHEPQPLKILKEEVFQRIFESEVPTSIAYNNIIHDQHDHEDDHEPSPEHTNEHSNGHSNEHSNGHGNHNDPSNDHADSNDGESNDYERKHNVEDRDKKWITVTIEGSNGDAKGNGKRKRLECSECGRVFSHRNSLMYHMLSHAARQHACPHCDKTFFTAGALKIHKRVHNGDKPYKCDLCGRSFRQWSDLKYHTISLHSNQKHFKCEFCGKEFARKYSLNLHRRIHTGERNYKCEYCSKTFSASSYRLTHMKTHTGDRPFKCDQCEKSFRSGFDLRRHCQVHEKIRNRFEENKPKPKEKKTKAEKEEKPAPKQRKQIKPESPEPPKKSPKKKSALKKGAPNVTVQNRDGQFKIDYQNPNTNTEPFEHAKNLQYTKFKVVYNDEEFKDPTPYKTQPYRDSDRDMAVLRTIREERHYRENTDGKLQIFTQIEKGKEYSGPIVSNSQLLGDIRHLEREVAREVRGDGSMNGEAENGFIERLTALYNVPA